MNIQWYPGHMKKTKESLQKSQRLVDFVLELRDARIPISSENPIIREIIPQNKLITILNKSDLADKRINNEWKDKIKAQGGKPYLLSATHKGSLIKLVDFLKTQRTGKIISKRVQLMIVGIPNVGKSTLINTLAGRRGLKVGNRPGVTKQIQWVRTEYDVNLLDTPGLLWHKFDDPQVGINLAITNAIKDEILDTENLAIELIKILKKDYPGVLKDKYLTDEDDYPYNIIETIARNQGMLLKGGVLHTERAAERLLADFRNGRLGKISLERP